MRAALVDSGLSPGPAREWRYFSNSSLPERRLALEAGLGRLGRHGLVVTPGHGSAVVLGLLLLPLAPTHFSAAEAAASALAHPSSKQLLSPGCEGCSACIDACPTGALHDGGFDRLRCLQHWSSIPGPLPEAIEAAWGARLYGCDACQEACPQYRPDALATTDKGLLGPALPATWLARAPEEEVRARLKGSALGMGWISIDALKRNAGFCLRGR